MGYDTYYSGELTLGPPANTEQVAYLQRFFEMTHTARVPLSVEDHPDPLREAVGLSVGKYGSFYTGDSSDGEMHNDGIGYSAPGHTIKAHRWGVPNRKGGHDPCVADHIHFNGACERWEEVLDVGYGEDDKRTVPDSYADLEISDDGAAITWQEGEKSYNVGRWIVWVCRWLLPAFSIEGNGAFTWDGEESDDNGVIVIRDNVVAAATLNMDAAFELATEDANNQIDEMTKEDGQ